VVGGVIRLIDWTEVIGDSQPVQEPVVIQAVHKFSVLPEAEEELDSRLDQLEMDDPEYWSAMNGKEPSVQLFAGASLS
jgi:hypothetical protein